MNAKRKLTEQQRMLQNPHILENAIDAIFAEIEREEAEHDADVEILCNDGMTAMEAEDMLRRIGG